VKTITEGTCYACSTHNYFGSGPCPYEHDDVGGSVADVVGDKPSDSQVGGNHYKDMKIQPAEFIHVNKIGFLEGNVIKYVCRHSAKNGKADLLKARHYIDLLLEWEYGEK
jgi:hypothetical protein